MAAADPFLQNGYRVYSNFIDGMKSVAHLWQLYLSSNEVVSDAILQMA